LPGLRGGGIGYGGSGAFWVAGESVQQAGECGICSAGVHCQRAQKLRLDQKKAAEIFGGGINAFSRYENGKTKPPLALVKLLKVLDRHPDLLNEVKAA
jgi:hypothetical protein